jgi:hypothetical protein
MRIHVFAREHGFCENRNSGAIGAPLKRGIFYEKQWIKECFVPSIVAQEVIASTYARGSQ